MQGEEREIAGVPTYVLRADDLPDPDQAPVYLDIHGGALIFGGGDLARLSGSRNAAVTGLVHWAVDYRVPPRHPFPAALDDVTAVYRALLDQRDPSDIVVGGGSAGGNLAAALLLRAKDEGLPLPSALVLLTPEADLTESGDSFHTVAAFDNTLGSLRPVNLLYANGRDLADPYLSPLFGDLVRLPAHVPDHRDARPLPLQHRPDAPQAPRRRSGRGAPRLRGPAARWVRRRPGGPRGLHRAAPVPRPDHRRLAGWREQFSHDWSRAAHRHRAARRRVDLSIAGRSGRLPTCRWPGSRADDV